MVCKKCNEDRRKKANESKKKAIVRSYKRQWLKWMKVLFLSVIWYAIYAVFMEGVSNGMDVMLRGMIAAGLLFMFFMILLEIGKMRPGLLSLSAFMIWAGIVTQFTSPITDLILLFLILSQASLLLDVGLGVIFKIKVTPVERPWNINREIKKMNDAKRGN